MQQVQETINKMVSDLITNVVKKYPSTNRSVIEQMWNSITQFPNTECTHSTLVKECTDEDDFKVKTKKESDSKVKVKTKKESDDSKVKTKLKSKVDSDDEKDDSDDDKPKNKFKKEEDKCSYVSSRGSKAGQECGSKLKPGSKYCLLHKKYEDTKETSEPVLRMNSAIGKLVHEKTSFVFTNDKEVCGKLVKDKVVPLTKDDIAMCKKSNFSVKESNINSKEKQLMESLLNKQDTDDEEDEVADQFSKMKITSKALGLQEEEELDPASDSE